MGPHVDFVTSFDKDKGIVAKLEKNDIYYSIENGKRLGMENGGFLTYSNKNQESAIRSNSHSIIKLNDKNELGKVLVGYDSNKPTASLYGEATKDANGNMKVTYTFQGENTGFTIYKDKYFKQESSDPGIRIRAETPDKIYIDKKSLDASGVGKDKDKLFSIDSNSNFFSMYLGSDKNNQLSLNTKKAPSGAYFPNQDKVSVSVGEYTVIAKNGNVEAYKGSHLMKTFDLEKGDVSGVQGNGRTAQIQQKIPAVVAPPKPPAQVLKENMVTFTKKYPGVQLVGDGIKPETPQKLTEILDKLTPELKKNVQKINIISSGKWADHVESVYGTGHTAGGYYSSSDKSITLPDYSVDIDTLAHESGHGATAQLNDLYQKRISSAQYLIDNPNNVGSRALEVAKKEIVDLPTTQQTWERISQPFGLGLGPITVGNQNAAAWADGGDYSHNGFVNSYAANNYKEDVSEMVNHAYTQSQVYWQERLSQDVSKTAVLKVTFPGEKPVYYSVMDFPGIIKNSGTDSYKQVSSREVFNWGFGRFFKDLSESTGSDTVRDGNFKGTKLSPTLVAINKKVDASNSDANVLINEVKAAGGKVENALYHPDYRKKLDQVRKWGLIPEAKYNSIVGAK